MPVTLPRCAWPVSDLDIAYHDAEWGVPVHDDRALFVGTTICYAFMQATGMVNDHVVTCFRYKDLRNSVDRPA